MSNDVIETDNFLLNDVYNYLIKDTLIPGESPNIANRLNDISVLEKSRGKLRFKKHKDKKSVIQAGDTVVNNGIKAEVIDTDGDLLCCRIHSTDEITVWYVNEVRKI